MQKINFNDQCDLTNAVIYRIKTKTRRIEKGLELLNDINFVFENGQVKLYFDGSYHPSIIKPRYHVGEIVAVAQPYKDIAENKYFINQCAANEKCVAGMKYEAGWNNKLFVAAYYMPHRIRITDIKVERLQDISDDDCLSEGIVKTRYRDFPREMYLPLGFKKTEVSWTPQGAFSMLIDKTCGKGTWAKNPFVFAYTFKLED